MIKNDISAFAIPIRYGMLDANDLNKKINRRYIFRIE